MRRLKEDEKEIFDRANLFRELLYDILSEERDKTVKITTSDYESPSWAFKQAHVNGKREQLDRILKFLSSTPRKVTTPDG